MSKLPIYLVIACAIAASIFKVLAVLQAPAPAAPVVAPAPKAVATPAENHDVVFICKQMNLPEVAVMKPVLGPDGRVIINDDGSIRTRTEMVPCPGYQPPAPASPTPPKGKAASR